MKTCTRCHETKDLDEFHLHPQRREGRQSQCKPCRNARARQLEQCKPLRSPAPPAKRFPIGVLMDAHEITPYELARRVGVTGPAVGQWRLRGVTANNADRVACALGLHPTQVWDDWLGTPV